MTDYQSATAYEDVRRQEAESATQRFAELFARAIESGAESDIPEQSPQCSTERPVIVALAAPLDPLPPTRQQLYHIANALAQRRRREFAEDLRIRQATPAAHPRPSFGCYEIADLTDETCRYPHERHGAYLFCGRSSKRGSPYCARHHRRCHE